MINIQRILELNKQFKSNDNSWTLWKFKWTDHWSFWILEKEWKIMLSAPHSVNHIRDNEIKGVDLMTWAIALFLWEILNIPVIYSKSFLVWDPNHDNYEDSEYKQFLLDYVKRNWIKMLIDIHGMSITRDSLIDLGTWWEWNPNLRWNIDILDCFINSFKKSFKNYAEKKIITVNKYFKSEYVNTISSFIANNTKLPSLQIEINWELRDEKRTEDTEKLIIALSNAIEKVNIQI